MTVAVMVRCGVSELDSDVVFVWSIDSVIVRGSLSVAESLLIAVDDSEAVTATVIEPEPLVKLESVCESLGDVVSVRVGVRLPLGVPETLGDCVQELVGVND